MTHKQCKNWIVEKECYEKHNIFLTNQGDKMEMKQCQKCKSEKIKVMIDGKLSWCECECGLTGPVTVDKTEGERNTVLLWNFFMRDIERNGVR